MIDVFVTGNSLLSLNLLRDAKEAGNVDRKRIVCFAKI